MARTIRDPKLNTRSARLELATRREPYWRSLSQGVAVGYRRGKKGGTWVARLYRPQEGRQYRALGTADDVLDADGETILSFDQAQARAREWIAELAAKKAADEETHPYTVRDAIEDYLRWFKTHRADYGTARGRCDAYILPALGDVEVSELTASQIRRLHESVAATPARLRSKRGMPPRYRPDPTTAEEKRRRRVTANKVLATLKAALNRAYHDGLVESADAWRRVRPFPNVESARVRYLSDDEAKRLTNACDPVFRKLVQAALLTGCRYQELARLKAADFDADAGTIFIATSKSGKSRHVVLPEEGRLFFEQVTAGLAGDALIFTRADGEPWGKSHQRRPMEEACTQAKITGVSFHILRHTHASRLAMAGVPMAVIAAQLGHADTRICERHYAHLAPSYVADTVRAAFGPFGIVETDTVAPLRSRR